MFRTELLQVYPWYVLHTVRPRREHANGWHDSYGEHRHRLMIYICNFRIVCNLLLTYL
jgi:hypothetical protein